jgi:hypothetical protein
MLAVTFFFTTTLALALHGGLILSAANPREGRGDEDAGSRRHVLPRFHRLLGRHAGHSPRRPAAGAQRRVLERRLHHHQRPVWTKGWPEWWNWWLELPIWPSAGGDVKHDEYQNIFTQVQVQGPPEMGMDNENNAWPSERPKPSFSTLSAGSATPSSAPSIWAGRGS